MKLLRSDDAAWARQDAAAQGIQFRGGTGSCVIDDYLTRIGAHHYEEIACLVQGRTSASVIVAAAPVSCGQLIIGRQCILGREGTTRLGARLTLRDRSSI